MKFGKKIFDTITPYERTFLVIEEWKNENEKILPIKLPLINTSVIFLENNDIFYIDDLESLNDLVFLDYDLITVKNSQESFTFKTEFDQFVKTVKTFVLKNGCFQMRVLNKVVYYNNINIICQIIERKEA